MELIDEDGFVFGRVNIVDLLVVLLVLAVAIAGVAFVVGGGGDTEQDTRTVVLDVGQQPDHVVDSIEEGQAPSSDVATIDDVATEDANGSVAVTLTVTLLVGENHEGLAMYDGERLHVDRQLQLDLGDVIVDGVVIEMEAS